MKTIIRTNTEKNDLWRLNFKNVKWEKIIFLFLILCQFSLLFGQKAVSQDDKAIMYNTKWGPWISAAGDKNILFSAKLKFYDKEKQLYAWAVKSKSLKTPIAFEFKITNQEFTGASDYDDAVKENDAYYKTSIFNAKDNENRINGGGFAIYSKSKTTLFYSIRNVCYEFEGREPNCDSKKTKNSKKNSNSLTSLSGAELNLLISKNIKQFLNEHTHLVYPNFRDEVQNVIIEDDEIKISIKEVEQSTGVRCPDGIQYYLYSIPLENLSIEKIINNSYSIGNLTLVKFKSSKYINLLQTKQRGNGGECTMGSGYETNNSYEYWTFEYQFGENDANLIELKNLIEALKSK